MNLRPKLILQMTPLVLIPIITIGVFAVVQIRQTVLLGTERQTETTLDRTQREFQLMLETAVANLELFASSPYLQKYALTVDEDIRYTFLYPGLLELFAGYQHAYPQYAEIRLLLMDGYEDARTTVQSIPNRTEQEAESEYFQELLAAPQRYWSKVLLNPDNAQPSLMVSRRLTYLDPEQPAGHPAAFEGFLVVTMVLDSIDQVVEAARIGESGRLHLVNDRGKRWWPANNGSSVPELTDQVMQVLRSGTTVQTTVDRVPYRLNLRTLKADFHVLSALPEDELTAPGLQLRNMVIGALLVAVVVVVGLQMWLLNSQLIRPISRLNAAAGAVGRGNLKVFIGHHGNDEIGGLVATFRAMGERLFNMQRDEAEHTDELQNSNRKLELAVEEAERAKVAAQSASEAKSEFLARMSHEIRTPMNGVLGMVELIMNTSLSPQQQHYSQIIRSSGKSLLAIINDILDFSKIEAGKLELEKSSFLLDRLVRETAESFAAQAEEKGLQISTSIATDYSKHVDGDSVRVGQVLTNLIGNAIKFTHEGSVALTVRQVSLDEHGIWTEFCVADTGVGIAAGNLDRIFDSFDQEDGSTTRKYGGTGLGLTICRQLVDLMGGKIWVESTPGEGSRFYFSLPFSTPASFEVAARLPTAKVVPLERTATVLVAEDNPVNLEVARGMLNSLNCEVIEAHDGVVAVKMVKSGGIDLVLMDCQMPVMDGFFATEAIRSWEKKQSRQPTTIVALTANAMDGDRKRCLNSGMDDYLSKPFTALQLSGVLQRWLAASDVNDVNDLNDVSDEQHQDRGLQSRA